MKIHFYLEIGYGTGHHEDFEYPDNTSPEQLEQDQAVWASNYLDSGYYKVEE
jgi:hypothetical protein